VGFFTVYQLFFFSATAIANLCICLFSRQPPGIDLDARELPCI
jgi:hypothetical protein